MQKLVAVQNICFSILLDSIQLNVLNCMVLSMGSNWHGLASTLQIIPVSYSKIIHYLEIWRRLMHLKSACTGSLERQFSCSLLRAWEDG